MQTDEKKMMTYQETMDYIDSLQSGGIVPGLDNIRALCEKLGNPQDALSFVHIAGTNGKGSVLCLVSSVLKQAGYRTGRYISPTIFDYRERFQIGERPISKKDLCLYMTRLKEACEGLKAEGNSQPTPFEVETALAFLYFKEKDCDIVVLETGMCGRLDATNIIQNTLVAVFASISLDHMRFLGNTLAEIAEEKAGIIKPGCSAVSAPQKKEVLSVLKAACEKQKVSLDVADPGSLKKIKSTIKGQRFSYGQYQDLMVTLAGRYQLDNALTALLALQQLSEKGFPVKEKDIYKGFAEGTWPGRFEVIGQKPLFIADGAHNRDGAARLADSIGFYFTNKRIIYIIGMLRDKEQEEILKVTCPYAEQILTVSTEGSRGLTSYELALKAKGFHQNVTCTDSVEEAIELAYLMADKDTVIVAFGSLSYLGKLITAVRNGKKGQAVKHG